MPEPASTSLHPAPETAPVLEHHLRADARRNRDAILRAAEVEFGARGPDVPVDDIARRAGVGVGTLYRHFPTKEDLLGALVTDRLEPLVAAASEASRASDPGAAFFALLHRLAAEFVAFRALAQVVAASGVDLHSAKGQAYSELLAAIGEALARAQGTGQVRRDVGATEIAAMMSGLCQAYAVADDLSGLSRCVGLLCDGLHPPRTGATATGS